ncbi:hypothetical protein [Alteripontixanthobacter muriae]|uniref:hypothetical protein n=1 Tax=Alteripontixanthobacter muriae TaxID=2705546 RepID=UPI0015763332|nr:hypothetical protein [Alteripontixanthobacter muriae]
MIEISTLERFGFDAEKSAGEPDDSPELRPLFWAELTARLAAARDLRHLLRAEADSELDTHGGSETEQSPSVN